MPEYSAWGAGIEEAEIPSMSPSDCASERELRLQQPRSALKSDGDMRDLPSGGALQW